MKIRSGFVSNSSSSSFIIISKGELTEEMLREALGSKAKSFPYGEHTFFANILSVLTEQENVACGQWGEHSVPIKDIVADGVFVYFGGHEDNTGSDVHIELCGTDLTAQTDRVKIIWQPR